MTKASRDPVDRITLDTLHTPLRKLSPAQWGMIRRAMQGDRSVDLLSRLNRELSDSPEVIG